MSAPYSHHRTAPPPFPGTSAAAAGGVSQQQQAAAFFAQQQHYQQQMLAQQQQQHHRSAGAAGVTSPIPVAAARPPSAPVYHQQQTPPQPQHHRAPATAAAPSSAPPQPVQHQQQQQAPVAAQPGYSRHGKTHALSLTPEEAEAQGRIIGDYMLCETIGTGSFGKVRRGVHILTKQTVAVKILNRQALQSGNMDKKIRREIKVLKLFNHPNICRLYDVLSTATDIFVVMEHCGGELYDYIVSKGRLDEAEARAIFQQVVCALEYCHHYRVVHRDLKPENILFSPESGTAKLIDFGLANLMQDGEFLRTSCGSPNYAAPEVISGRLYAGPEVDVWSCGVVLYALLCGCLPFDEENIPALFSKIKRGKYPPPTHVSPEGRDLIRQLLVVNPMERITIPQIRDHPWFRTSLPRYLEYRESLFIAAEFIDEDVLEEAAEVTGASVETIRESIARAAVAAPDRNAVVYNVLLDRNRQASIAAGGAPDDAVSGSTITHVTSSQRELNQGRILSCSPGIVVLLDQNEASVNKRAYNYAADFLPASLAQHLSPAHQASGAARAVSASPSSFTFSRLANASAGASSFSERVGSFQQRTMSGLSPGLRPMATPPGHVPAAGGGSSVARAYPGGLPPPATRAGSIIGSVAPMQAVYAPEEAEFTAQNFTGWRVGLMTDESSGQAIRELCTVLASLGCEWKTLSPFWLGVRRKHDPRRAAAAAAAAAAAEQARLAAASSTPVGSPAKAAKALGDLSGSQNIAADSAAATSQQVAAAPTVIDACVLGIQLMRLQEQHNKGYVFDFQLFEGSTFEAIELATQIWSRLQCRVG